MLTGDFPVGGGEQEVFLDFRGRSGGGLKVGGLEGEGNRLTGTEGYYRWSGKMERGKRLSWGETSRWSRREGWGGQREEDLEEGGRINSAGKVIKKMMK